MSNSIIPAAMFGNHYVEPSILIEPINDVVTVVRNGSIVPSPSWMDFGSGGWDYAATIKGNDLTGYFTTMVKPVLFPNSLPGAWKTPKVWESYAPNQGVNREVRYIELIASSKSPNATYRNDFCNSLTDLGGNPKKPKCCGGSDPDIYLYNPQTAATIDAKKALAAIATSFEKDTATAIAENRKKIVAYAVIVLAIISITYLILN